MEDEFVWSGNTKVPILGYGTMRAYGTHPITLLQVELELENTVYIPTFHTSLISMKKLRKRGYKWDQNIDCLVNAKGIVCEVLDMFDLYPIEYNKPKPAAFKTKKKSAQKPVLEGTMDTIHMRFGHANPEIIKHLPDAVEGIKLIESDDEEYDTIESQEPESEPLTESRKQGESDGPSIGIPTPELTPEPPTFQLPSEPIRSPSVKQDVEEELNKSTTRNRAPRAAEISADIDERLIISGSRSRRKDAHHSAIQDPSQYIGFRSAFALGLERPEKKIHRDDMPTSPRNWKEFNNHKYREQYLQAREVEWTELLKRQTFEEVPLPPEIRPIPVKWVDLEKYDKDGYLMKFKSRLVVRGDLQIPTLQDNYAATLAARTFRFMMALVAAYDLDAEQLDAVNAFVNSPIDDLIYVELPNGYKKKGRCLRLRRALWFKAVPSPVAKRIKAIPGVERIQTTWRRAMCLYGWTINHFIFC